jgi:hypothetical protein
MHKTDWKAPGGIISPEKAAENSLLETQTDILDKWRIQPLAG